MNEGLTQSPSTTPTKPPSSTKIVLVGGTNDAQRLRWEHDLFDAIIHLPHADTARTVAFIGAAGRGYTPDASVAHDIVARAEVHPTCVCCPDGKIVSEAQKIISQNPAWLVIEVLTPLLMLMRDELHRELPEHSISTVMIRRSMRATAIGAGAPQSGPLWDILGLVDFNVSDAVTAQRAIDALIDMPKLGTPIGGLSPFGLET